MSILRLGSLFGKFGLVTLFVLAATAALRAGDKAAIPRLSDPSRGSISLWVKQTEPISKEEHVTLFSLSDPGSKEMQFELLIGGARNLRADAGNESQLRVIAGANPTHRNGNYFINEDIGPWLDGSWHHIVLSWDANVGELESYIDGTRRAVLHVANAAKNFHEIQWSIDRQAVSYIICEEDSAKSAILDKVEVFEEPISFEKARSEFLKHGQYKVRPKLLDAFFFEKRDEECRIVFENPSREEIEIEPSYSVIDEQGVTVQKGVIGPISIGALTSIEVSEDLHLPRPGVFRIEFTCLRGSPLESRALRVRAVGDWNGADATSMNNILIDQFDATQMDPVAESAASTVVNSRLGSYREAGSNRNDRFAMAFNIQDVGEPHIATILYPDDKQRTMEVILQRLEAPGDINDYQAQSGVLTGGDYPSSHRMESHKVLFWPTAHKMSLIFTTVEDGMPAAVAEVKIERVENGLDRLPIESYQGSVPGRSLGVYYEDPVLNKSFSTSPLFPGYESAVDTLLDYMDWFGQDTLHYPLAWYRGPLYGSQVEPVAGDLSARPHPHDYPSYLMKRLEGRGMKFNGGLHIHDMGSLLEHANLDAQSVLAGEETAINVRADNKLLATGWHRVDSNYNPLDPAVQGAVKDLVAEIAERYGDLPAFTGLTLVLPRHKLFAFGSLKSGYNDINLQGFQSDTGIRIPVDKADKQRFAKSYQWLMENARREWVDWRCQRIREYYKELADILSKKRSDLKLTVNLFARPELYHERLADYRNGTESPDDVFAEAGVDPRLYVNDQNIVFSHTMVPADKRYYRHRSEVGEKVNKHRTVYFAPEVTATMRSHTAGAWAKIHDRYFENSIGATQPMKELGVAEVGWRVSTLNPGARNALEAYAVALNNLDALEITKGGFVIGTYGTEEVLGDFAKAYRSLPAVRFDDVEGLADPVRVRQKVVDGRAWFYVLNTLPVESEATLHLRNEADLRLKLKPYELLAYSRESQIPVVEGGRATADPEFVSEISDQLARFEEMGVNDSASKSYLQYAKRCAKEKRYSRLFRLLQEGWTEGYSHFE